MRYWRILNVEDNQYYLKRDIYKRLYSSIENSLQENWDFNIYEPGISEWDKEPEFSFPIVFNSITKAWTNIKLLSDENLTPDVCFIDIKLTDHSDPPNKLDEIKKELLLFFNDKTASENIEQLFIPENSAENGKCDIQIKGGLFIMALIKRLFPNAPIFIYTESKEIFKETIPFQFAGGFKVLSSGKFLIPYSSEIANKEFWWTNILVDQMVLKIQSGAVSLPEIHKALNEFKKHTINFSPEDYYINRKSIIYKDHLTKLLFHNIGLNEKDWIFATFFVLQLLDLASKEKAKIDKGLEEIQRIISLINLPKSLMEFITNTDFHAFSHSHQLEIANPIAKNLKPIELLVNQQFDKLKNISSRILDEWTRCNCSSKSETNEITQLLKEATESSNKNDFEEIFRKFDLAKKSIRISLSKVYTYIETAKQTCTDLNLRIILHDSNGVSELESYDIAIRKLNNCSHLSFLPISRKDNDYQNILSELIETTFTSIYEHSFNRHPSGDDYVEVHIFDNTEQSTWTIKLSQFGGSNFEFEKLNDPYFFNASNGGDFRKRILKVKNWIDVQIVSNGYQRNPHLIMSSKKVTDDSLIDKNSTIEFLYTINYL